MEESSTPSPSSNRSDSVAGVRNEAIDAGQLEQVLVHLSERIEEQNRLLREQLAYHRSIRERIIAGMWMGLGTVVGATVLFTLLAVAVRPLLKPLSNLSWVGPIVDRVLEDMESRQRRAPYYRQDAPLPERAKDSSEGPPSEPSADESKDINAPYKSVPGKP